MGDYGYRGGAKRPEVVRPNPAPPIRTIQTTPTGGEGGSAGGVAPGWEVLARYRFATALLATSGPIVIAARELLRITVVQVGFNVADIPALRFNADAAGANYRSRHVLFSNVNPPVNSAVDFAASGHIVLSDAANALEKIFTLEISNLAAAKKVAWINNAGDSSVQGTVPFVKLGWGKWYNAAAQIASVELLANAGNLFAVGSSIVIEGINP